MIKSNKVYDILKYISFVFYPAVVTLVGTILKTTGYNHTEIVLIIMGAVETFLGSILGYSNIKYNKEK